MSKDKTDKRVKKLFSGIQLADSKPFHDNNGAGGQVAAASPVSEGTQLSNPVMLWKLCGSAWPSLKRGCKRRKRADLPRQ